MQMAVFLCTLTHTLHTHSQRERENSLESLLLRALISLGQGSKSMTSSKSTYFPKTPSLMLSHWRLELQHMSLGEAQRFNP